MFSRDNDRLIGGKKKKRIGMARHVHNKDLGKTAYEGRSVGQKMILGHKKKDMTSMASPEHDRKQMRKHRITV